jgi:transglutaminase-like putative cysteine protease
MGYYPQRSRPSKLSGIPSGDAGVRATLTAMAKIVRQYKVDANIHELARRLTAALPPQNTAGATPLYLATLQQFVRDKIRYVMDTDGVETLQTPDYTLSIMAGDCDDKSILLATLLASVGYPPMFFAVGTHGQPYSHVLAGARIGTRQIPLETIIPAGNPGANPGQMPPGVTSCLPWNI